MLKLLFKLGAKHRKGMIFISKPFPSNSQVFTYLWCIFSHIYIPIGCSSILLPYINYTIHLFIQSTKNYYLHTTVWIQIKHPDYCADYSMIKKNPCMYSHVSFKIFLYIDYTDIFPSSLNDHMTYKLSTLCVSRS